MIPISLSTAADPVADPMLFAALMFKRREGMDAEEHLKLLLRYCRISDDAARIREDAVDLYKAHPAAFDLEQGQDQLWGEHMRDAAANESYESRRLTKRRDLGRMAARTFAEARVKRITVVGFNFLLEYRIPCHLCVHNAFFKRRCSTVARPGRVRALRAHGLGYGTLCGCGTARKGGTFSLKGQSRGRHSAHL